jgi:enamine deaminase RidA (YjgF/YER057c/UK114 family)
VYGDTVYVSGTTGYDYTTMTLAEGVTAQCEQTLRNIETALSAANCSFDDVVRVTYIFPDPADFEPCWPLLRAAFGAARPAATMFSGQLLNPDIKVEIEVTARSAAAK